MLKEGEKTCDYKITLSMNYDEAMQLKKQLGKEDRTGEIIDLYNWLSSLRPD